MYEWDRLQNLNAISIILSALGVQDRGQMDLGSVGPKFTWRGQENRDYGRVSERLDRGFVNQALRLKFPDLSIKVLSGLKSDHHLLLAELVPKDRNLQRPQRPFRFEAAWISRTNFSQNGTSKYSAIFSRERRRCQHDWAVFKRRCTYNYLKKTKFGIRNLNANEFLLRQKYNLFSYGSCYQRSDEQDQVPKK